MAIFEGAGVAIVTPMHADGSINYDKFEELIEEQIAGGTDCIIAVGTTGEGSTLTEPEHIDAIRFAVEVTKHRIPVIGGTGSNSTASAPRWHILPDNQSVLVAPVEPQVVLQLDVLAHHVHAKVLHYLQVIYHSFVRGWGQQSVGPPALIQRAVHIQGFVVQQYGRMSVSTILKRLWPDSLDRLTWSRFLREITWERTERAVQVQDVHPITIATIVGPR